MSNKKVNYPSKPGGGKYPDNGRSLKEEELLSEEDLLDIEYEKSKKSYNQVGNSGSGWAGGTTCYHI